MDRQIVNKQQTGLMNPDEFYAALAPVYDRMIPWPRRLDRERHGFEALWQRVGARSVLDAACGSGAHLGLFMEQGLEVTGADASAPMLQLARERFADVPAGKRPRLVEAAWSELPQKLPDVFDAVLCLGNSLPHVIEAPALEASLRGLWACVAPGGVLLIQFKNFARMRRRGERFLPLTTGDDPETGREYLFVRQYDWREAVVDFSVIVLSREAGEGSPGWVMRHTSVPLATYMPETIEELLKRLGARVERYGSLGLAPFDETDSEDVLLEARRLK